MDPFAGKYFSLDYLRRQILKQTEAEIAEIDKQIEKEIADGKLADPATIDPMTGMPMEDPAAMGEVPQEETGPGGVEAIAPADYKRGEF
jgi:hypothetical protein